MKVAEGAAQRTVTSAEALVCQMMNLRLTRHQEKVRRCSLGCWPTKAWQPAFPSQGPSA